MANQVIVTDSGNVQVAVSPPANVQVQISRSVIGTVANVASANYANFAGTVTGATQSNITTVGTLGNLSVANTITTLNLNVTGNLAVGNLIANSANYANFANVSNIANSVAGSNVTGAVANATYANSANTANLATYATTANSVAVANVSGIGNIAITNYDGNGSNILHGNGFWGPEIGPQSVANANYANFAGTAYSVSGSNVSGEVAYASVANSVAGGNVSGAVGLATYATTANAVAGANVSGQVSYAAVANSVAGANVSGAVSYATVANSVALANVSGAGNIASLNLDGNASNILYGNGVFSAAPSVSNVANANYANFAGTAYSVSGANVSGEVANANYSTYSGTAASANSVAGANVSGQVSYAAVANSVAVANVSGIGNIATVNLDGSSSNVLYGNGVFAPESTSIANANYANFAGTVITNAQPNITSTGNLVSLNINNGVAGSTTKQFAPNGVTIISTANTNLMSNSSFVDIDYGNGQGDGNVLLPKAQTYLKTRGNSSSQTTANVNDRVGRTNYSFFNGTNNVLAAATQVIGNSSFNANANAVTTAGQFQIITGNPNGDQGNANALSNQNIISADPFGRLSIQQGAAGSTSSCLSINTYGGSGGGNATATQQITFLRLRGNRDGNLSVQPNDQLGGIQFSGWNGTAQFATRIPSMTAIVDGSYVANTTAIPAGLRFQVCDNTTTYTHQFYANGNVAFNGTGRVTAGFYYGDGSNLSNIVASSATTAVTVTANAQPNITSVGNAFSSGQLALNTTGAGSPRIDINGTVGSSNGYIVLNQGVFQVFNQDLGSGLSPFQFNISGNSAYQEPMNYFRCRNTQASPANLVAGDIVMTQRWQGYANGTTNDLFNVGVTYGGYTTGVGAYSNYGFGASGDTANSAINFSAGTINLQGNVVISPGNTFSYTRTFGDFYNSSTITPGAANTPAVLPLGSTGTAQNCSIQSTSQLLISKSGNYNIQFSLQAVNSDNSAEHDFWVWLRKNGSDVTNSATNYTVIKNNGKNVAMLSFNVSSNGSDYFEIAYAVADTQITFPAYAANSQGFTHPAIPSLILNVIPIGA